MLKISARLEDAAKFKGMHHIAGSDFTVEHLSEEDKQHNFLGSMIAKNDGTHTLHLEPTSDTSVIIHEVLEAVKWGNGLNLPHITLSTLSVGLADFLRELGIRLVVEEKKR